MKLRTLFIRGAFGLGFVLAVTGLKLNATDSSVATVAVQMSCESSEGALQVMVNDEADQTEVKTALPARARAWRFNLPGGVRLAR